MPTAVRSHGQVRRRPQQQRSIAKFDAMLDAADDLVATDGVASLTTTRVAERAGIAVGSVYQYFDGVPDLIDALVARHAERFATHLRDELAHRRFRRKRDAANATLDALIDYQRAEPAFRSLWHSAPRVIGAGFTDAAEPLVEIVTRALVDQGLVEASDDDFAREAEVQWAVAAALIPVAFRLDPDGDPTVLAHLRRLFDLDVRAVARS